MEKGLTGGLVPASYIAYDLIVSDVKRETCDVR